MPVLACKRLHSSSCLPVLFRSVAQAFNSLRASSIIYLLNQDYIHQLGDDKWSMKTGHITMKIPSYSSWTNEEISQRDDKLNLLCMSHSVQEDDSLPISELWHRWMQKENVQTQAGALVLGLNKLPSFFLRHTLLFHQDTRNALPSIYLR